VPSTVHAGGLSIPHRDRDLHERDPLLPIQALEEALASIQENRMHPSAPQTPHARQHETGVALILGIFFTIIVVGITVTGALALRSHQTKTRTSFVSHGQAVQFARSGLTEALGWLRKQTAQPVVTFDPRLDTTVNPPIIDTEDPVIGIAREFKITDAIWGRYEVWKDWSTDPDPVRLRWRNQMRCVDVSAERGNLSPGSVWKLRSIGYVFRRVDATVPFDQLPNQVLGQEVLEVEARRLALQPPGQAALCIHNGNACRVLTKGRIQGGSAGAGIYYLQGTGAPAVSGAGASVTGVPPMTSTAVYADTMNDVFGVSLAELKAMADSVITNPIDFPNPVPMNTLVVCEVPMTFTSTFPLRGTGVVVFEGAVNIDPGSNSAFSGLVYAAANLTMREPAELQGAVVALGNTTLQGSADFSTLIYDDGILNALRQNMGSYRLSGAITRPLQQNR
jgi:hypothetical protein